jgi:hypothetical protein
MEEKGQRLKEKARSKAGLFLSLDQPGKHQMMVGTNGSWVLVSGARKSHHVPPDFRERNHFIHKSGLGAINGP